MHISLALSGHDVLLKWKGLQETFLGHQAREADFIPSLVQLGGTGIVV